MAEERNMREKQVAEAKARLEALRDLKPEGLMQEVLDDFDRGQVHYSERVPFGAGPAGALYWIDNRTAKSREGKPFADVVAEFEQAFDGVVYHTTHEFTEYGELLDLFYVSKHEEEWEMDRGDLQQGRALAYVANLSDPLCSEVGAIGFRPSGGGLVRTA